MTRNFDGPGVRPHKVCITPVGLSRWNENYYIYPPRSCWQEILLAPAEESAVVNFWSYE